MLTSEQALERLDHLLTLAKAAGADAADAVYVGEESVAVGVRLGSLEELTRSEDEEIGIRLFLGRRSAQVSTSDLTQAALAEVVERARAMAEGAPEDPYAGLAPAGLLAQGAPADLDIDDPEVAGLPPERLRAMALAAEEAARAVAGVTNSEGGSAAAGRGRFALATSNGFRGASAGTSVSVSAAVVAGEGAAMQRDYDWHQARHLADLDSPESVGRTAGERAVGRLDPVKVPTGQIPVFFDRRVAGSLLGHLVGAMNGAAIARGTSFLLGRGGERLFAPGITIVDDPRRPRGLRSRAFDGEGLPTARRELVSDGVLGGWLVDVAAGHQLGLPPTGQAVRGAGGPPSVGPSNLWLAAGEQSVAALMADVGLGLYVTELIGMGVNGLTGDYSRGAGGFLIRNGALAEPVAEATIAGNLRDMFARLVPADDLRFRSAVNAPTVRIDGMTVAGNS
jgi:PmbA protein